MEEKIEEGEIKGAIEPATMRQIKIILNQMKKSVCKILEPKYATGFFCNIEINNKNTRVLITNYHVIDDEFIESGKKIKVQLGNDKNPKIINLNKDKIIYSNTNKEYDIMVIKLDETDEIDNIQFLEIDNSLLKQNSEIAYEDKSIYILHYPFGSEIRVSYGRGFKKDNDFDMIHKCKTNNGSSGSPIFELSSNKIIGIHKCYINRGGNKNEESFNLGTFLKYPIIDIRKKFQEEEKNNSNSPLKDKTSHPMEKNKNEKSNIDQDINSFNELRPNHQKIKYTKDLEKNNVNDKISKRNNTNPYHDSNAFDCNKNNNHLSKVLRKDDTKKINSKNNPNFHKKQKNCIPFKENMAKKDEMIINQGINNNKKSFKIEFQNMNKNDNKRKIVDTNKIQNIKINKKENKDKQNIHNNINNEDQFRNNNIKNIQNINKGKDQIKNINNKEQIIKNQNNKELANNPDKNIQNNNNDNKHSINEQTNIIQNIINKKEEINNNNQNINDKKEEIENNRKNNIKNIHINNKQNNQIKNNQIKDNQNINNNNKEINNHNLIIQFANYLLNGSNNQNIINIGNDNININNNVQNINNRYSNNNKNIVNKINPNINIRKDNESELILKKDLLNINASLTPNKPMPNNYYIHKKVVRNKINNNKPNIKNFNNIERENNDISKGTNDSDNKNRNKLKKLKFPKLNDSDEDKKFLTNRESFEKNNEMPNFISNLKNRIIKRRNSCS